MFGGFQDRALKTYELLKQPGTRFAVVAAAEPDAARGGLLRRSPVGGVDAAGRAHPQSHPPNLTGIPEEVARVAVDKADDDLTRGVLLVHAERAATAKREVHLLGRFTSAHPTVPIVGVPSLPFEVADRVALRAVAEQITGRG